MKKTPVRRITARAVILLLSMSLMVQIFSDVSSEEPKPALYKEPDEIPLFTHKGPISISEVSGLFSDLGGSGGDQYQLVQFDRPITGQMKRSLTGAGLTVLDYMPDLAFVVKMNDHDPSIFQGIDHINGWTPFPSEMKISPALHDMLANGIIDPEFTGLVVETFVPSDEAEMELGMTSPHPERVSSTRYDLGFPITSLVDIALIEDVKWIEPKANMVLFNNVADGILDVDTIRSAYDLDGTGQIVAVADSGIDTGIDNHSVNGDIHLDFDNRLVIRDWSGDGPEDDHGHGTHVTGSVAGNGARSGGNIKGMAPNASIVFQAIGTGSSGSLVTPSNISQLFKQAYDLGARVHTNSWGTDSSALYGRYTADSYQADWTQFHYSDQLVIFAAGNDGSDYSSPLGKIDPGQVSPPSTAKSIVTVGASENYRPGSSMTWGSFGFGNNPISSDRVADDENGLAAFSSRGPTDDNRIKPDVVAPGTYILSTRSSIGSSGGWGGYDSYYHYNGGTSMSTPITAGTATLVRQFYNDTIGLDHPLNSLIKATLINGAVDLTPGQYGTGTVQEVNSRPDIDQGWGRVNLQGSIYPSTGNFDFENNVDGLRTGENFTKVFRVNSPEELRVTLAWSDHPGSYFSGKYLVNDLDLILTAPNGTVYRGNDLIHPFDDTTDDINPVESVTVPSPAVGWWKIEVNGSNIPKGPQHFAVVLSGNTTNMIANSLLFDKNYYSTDNAEVTLRLTVSSLIGKGTIRVNLTSTSCPIGRTVTLFEEGEYGSFTGSIRTWNGSTDDPARIFVSPDDSLYAWFVHDGTGILYDASASVKRPQRVDLFRLPENHIIYSEGDILLLKGNGTVGAHAQWSIPGSSLGWSELFDDGDPLNGDDMADDGLYSSRMLIPEDTHAAGTIVVRVFDPYLGILDRPQFPLEINTSMPRAPRELEVETLPRGNSLELSWKRSSEPDMEYHSVFINATPLNLSYDEENWVHLFDTIGRENRTEVDGLADEVEYYFRVATVNTSGVLSSLSPWAIGVPFDSKAPSVDLDLDPFVIAGEVDLTFHADDDLELLEVQYYNDTNGDGIDNDGNQWESAGNSTTNVLVWDTREEQGGPGNLENMVLRARGTDEMANVGKWSAFAGFSVDNIGPRELRLDALPLRIGNVQSHSSLLGYTEPLSTVSYYLNGDLLNTTSAGSNGIFGIDLDLDEGYNLLELVAHDRHGAGPVSVNYEFTLDTMEPYPDIDDLPGTLELSHEGFTFYSNSSDRGVDPEFRKIIETVWEIRLPTGEVKRGEGDSYHLDMRHIGNHTLTLTVEDMAGNTNSTIGSFIIEDTQPPVPSVFGSFEVCEDTSVRFSSYGTRDNDPLLILSRDTLYNWTFTGKEGWNHTSERNETTVIFPEPGSYTGILKVTDRSGNQGTTTFDIEVLDITPPTGTISARKWAYLDEFVYFNATFKDNYMEVFSNSTYTWSVWFLDDHGKRFYLGEENGSSLGMDFEDTGNYTLVLNVTDPGGNTAMEEHTIWIKDRPMVIEEEGFTPEERSYTFMIIIGVVLIILLVGALIFIGYLTKEKIHDVDWADDELEELDELDEDLEDEVWEWD